MLLRRIAFSATTVNRIRTCRNTNCPSMALRVAVALVASMLVPVIQARLPPIVFKSVSNYDLIWKDAGSGARFDVSYWRLRNFLDGEYFSAGDVATASHSEPKTPALALKAVASDALRPPRKFAEVWTERGSGAHKNVRIMKMLPPDGYVCLGNVVVEGHWTEPSRDKYRCIKFEYVTVGHVNRVWHDVRSGADKDVSNWEVIQGSDRNGLEAGCFISTDSWNEPDDIPFLLDSRYAMDSRTVNLAARTPPVLKLYQSTDMELVWKDSGSGGTYDFSCWRVSGPANTHRLADVPRGNYDRPRIGLVATSQDASALQRPYSFRLRWKDVWSFATLDGAFWEPLCSRGYVAIGHLCTQNYDMPDTDDVRCVRVDLVSMGSWQWVWNDKGTRSTEDCSVYRTIASSDRQIGIDALAAVPRHGTMDRICYALNRTLSSALYGKPVRKYFLTNVHYDLWDKEVVSSEVSNLARTTVENHGRTSHTVSRTQTALWSETRSWSVSSGIETGVEIRVSASVPLINLGFEVTASTRRSFTCTACGQFTETKTESITATISVKPNTKKTVVIVGTNSQVNVPFTANKIIEYQDGTVEHVHGVKGVYSGLSAVDRRVVYEPDAPL